MFSGTKTDWLVVAGEQGRLAQATEKPLRLHVGLTGVGDSRVCGAINSPSTASGGEAFAVELL
jgi:hypothetical protein